MRCNKCSVSKRVLYSQTNAHPLAMVARAKDTPVALAAVPHSKVVSFEKNAVAKATLQVL